MVRMVFDPRTRPCVARRTNEGRSKREIIRSLKRYVARELYRCLPRPHPARRPIGASEPALDGLERTATETDEILSGVTEQDLGDPAPVGDGQIRYARTRGFELPRTVEGAMMMFVIHEEHHASRIARAKDCRLRGTRAS